MTTYTVISNADHGAGTLRSDLGLAKDGDIINFAPGVQLITLSNPLEIKTNVAIQGTPHATGLGTPSVVITGNSTTSEFVIDSGVSTSIDGVELSYGASTGALTSKTTGTIAAGAIYNRGTLTLSNSLLDHNSGIGFRGYMPSSATSYVAGGAGGIGVGGIYVASGATLNLVGSTNSFAANTGTGGYGGNGANGSGDRLDVAGPQFDRGGFGGGGAVAKSGMPKQPAKSGYKGDALYSGDGAGGAPYQAGQAGTKGPDGFRGSGGGGSGGNAFADYGGLGTINTVPVCFVTGTAIRTTRGECAVEDLVVGDVAVTASGETRPIVWIGHRDIDCCGRHELHPVRVAAHAFGTDLPARDLWLSPGHPVLIGADETNAGGHLVPIMCLINGTTIAQMAVNAITYWHVELDAHDILLAEGLPAESYLDWGDRGFFQENPDHRIDNPDFVVPGLASRCRPVSLDGPIVEAERYRLDAVFVTKIVGACAWPSETQPLTSERADAILW